MQSDSNGPEARTSVIGRQHAGRCLGRAIARLPGVEDGHRGSPRGELPGDSRSHEAGTDDDHDRGRHAEKCSPSWRQSRSGSPPRWTAQRTAGDSRACRTGPPRPKDAREARRSAARLLRIEARSGRFCRRAEDRHVNTQPHTPSPARAPRSAARMPLVVLAIAGASVMAAGVGGYLAQSQRQVGVSTVEARPAQPALATTPAPTTPTPAPPSLTGRRTSAAAAPAAIELSAAPAEPVEVRTRRITRRHLHRARTRRTDAARGPSTPRRGRRASLPRCQPPSRSLSRRRPVPPSRRPRSRCRYRLPLR